MGFATQKRVSVVIPTYNCAQYIAETLNSVLYQTRPPHEIIIVDDGSTDGTGDIVRSFGNAVQWVQQTNQGVCVARNRGLALSTGEFLCFLDHDDYWLPHKLQHQLDSFEAHPETGVVFTRFALWHPEQGSYPRPDQVAAPDDVLPPSDPAYSGWIYHQFLLDCWALTSTAMIRREALDRCGGFDPSLPYSEDWELWLRISREFPFFKLDGISTLYRQHPQQGNRQLRAFDFRTSLLESAAARWGMRSPDGRAVEASVFHATLSRYHLHFALHHMQSGSKRVALASLRKAWRHRPSHIKLPVLMVATLLGWRPGA